MKAEAHIGAKVFAEDISGPLILLPEKIESFFLRNIRVFTEIIGFKRVEIPEYPREAFREAEINAIIHREYKEGARVFIKIFSDRIEIMSPGCPLSPLTLAGIRTYHVPPYSRNPHLAMAFNNMNFMEERGTGLGRMRDYLKKHDLNPPRFSIESGYFVVTFFGQNTTSEHVKISPDILKQLNSGLQELLKIIIDKKRYTNAECREHFNVSKKTANKYINKLIEIGVVERRGSSSDTYYVIYGS